MNTAAISAEACTAMATRTATHRSSCICRETRRSSRIASFAGVSWAKPPRRLAGRRLSNWTGRSAQALLDMHKRLKSEVAELVVEIIHRHTVSDKFNDEEVALEPRLPAHLSRAPCRSPGHRVEARCSPASEPAWKSWRAGRLPEGAEAGSPFRAGRRWRPPTTRLWRWCLGFWRTRRKFQNRIVGQAWADTYLRQTERSQAGGEDSGGTAGWERHAGGGRAGGNAASGLLCAPGTRVSMAGNEFGLGVFAFACMLLTHPERLSAEDTLMIDCGGRRVLRARRLHFRPRPAVRLRLSAASSSASSTKTGRATCGARPLDFCQGRLSGSVSFATDCRLMRLTQQAVCFSQDAGASSSIWDFERLAGP